MRSFEEKRTEIETIFREAGIEEVHNNLNAIPGKYPCCHYKLKKRIGKTPMGKGFEEYLHVFELYLSTDETQDPDGEIMKLITSVEAGFIRRFFVGFGECEIYEATAEGVTTVTMANVSVEV